MNPTETNELLTKCNSTKYAGKIATRKLNYCRNYPFN